MNHGHNNKINLNERDFYYGWTCKYYEGNHMGNFIQSALVVVIFRLDKNNNELYKIRN